MTRTAEIERAGGHRNPRPKRDARRIAGVAWKGSGLLVEFGTGERFLLPAETLRQITGRRLRGTREVRVARNRLAVQLPSRTGMAEVPWDFIRRECDARFRRSEEASAAEERLSVGERLARARKEAGFTQKALAERAGVSRTTVARIETGANTPALVTLDAIATALSLTVPELLQLPE